MSNHYHCFVSYSFLCQVLVHVLWASTVEYKNYNYYILMWVWNFYHLHGLLLIREALIILQPFSRLST